METPRIYKAQKPGRFLRSKAGSRPADWVVDALARSYPAVTLIWEPVHERWCLVEDVGGEPVFITMLQEREGGYQEPTIGNTVRWLDRHSTRALINCYEIERFLGGIDETKEALEREDERKAMDRLHDAHDTFRDVLRDRTIIQVKR